MFNSRLHDFKVHIFIRQICFSFELHCTNVCVSLKPDFTIGCRIHCVHTLVINDIFVDFVLMFDSYKYAKCKETAQDPCLLHVLDFRLELEHTR